MYLVPVLRRAALAGAGGLLLTLVAGPAIAAPAPDAPPAATDKADLAVTAKFDKASYAAGDPVTATVIVKNNGKVAATEIRSRPDTPNGITWSEGENFPVFELAAGASTTLKRVGAVNAQGAEFGYINTIFLFQPKGGDAKANDNRVTLNAPVPGATGTFVGRAVQGKDREVDPARPPVAGVTFTLTSERTQQQVKSGKTDAKGVVTLTGVPADRYRVEYTAPTGWKLTTTSTAQVTAIRKDKQETVTVSLLPTGTAPVTPNPSGSASASASPSPKASASASASPAPGQAGGGLPVTGASVGVLAGVGALVVAAGAVAFVVARRRRTRFIAGS